MQCHLNRLSLVSVLVAALLPAMFQQAAAGDPTRIIVLGIDGMDYELTQQWMADGKLPHMRRLATQGTFKPLQTTNPPLSPVAWSTFITGMDPGGHGVFDFLRRSPAQVGDGFSPEDAVTTVAGDSTDTGWRLPFTDYVLPPSRRHRLLRVGTPFWQLLESAGVPTVTYKMPAAFPAEEEPGRLLAGMGVPDVAGTYGTFTYLTTEPDPSLDETSGGHVLHVTVEDGVVSAQHEGDVVDPFLRGPLNPFRTTNATQPTVTSFQAYVDQEARTGVVILQDQTILLREGEWSEWLEVEFQLLPLPPARGMVRICLQEVQPDFRLFISAVHPVPGSDGLASESFDLELAEALGHFHTKGMPQETGAYLQGVLNTEQYIAHSRILHDETLAALNLLLRESNRGVLFVYFSTLDLDSHVLWAYQDVDHPAHDPAQADAHGDHILRLYQEIDRVVGATHQGLAPGEELYVISDHGFTSLRHDFNLTSWLAQAGYLHYQDGFDPDDSAVYSGIDWTKTQAYGVGFNGLYVNLAGREREGAVAKAQYDALIDEIQGKLLAIKHDGQRVFENVYRPEDIYGGTQRHYAPDLILAYRPPFGPSDDSVLGTPSDFIINDRLRGFTGHHTTDASFVPGILLSTQRLTGDQPRLQDVTATLLDQFGVPSAPQMTGRPLKLIP